MQLKGSLEDYIIPKRGALLAVNSYVFVTHSLGNAIWAGAKAMGFVLDVTWGWVNN